MHDDVVAETVGEHAQFPVEVDVADARAAAPARACLLDVERTVRDTDAGCQGVHAVAEPVAGVLAAPAADQQLAILRRKGVTAKTAIHSLIARMVD